MTNKRRNGSKPPASNENYNYQNYDNTMLSAKENNYNSQLLKSIEKKTMGPLANNYVSDAASRSRAAALAEADRMVERSQRLRGMSDLNDRESSQRDQPQQ